MSEDLIKRSDAIEVLRKLGHEVVVIDKVCSLGVAGEFIDAIRTIPSADRPQGEWIDMGDFEQCSVCKGTRLKEFQSYYGKTTWVKTPYCPNCGCRMKGANDE